MKKGLSISVFVLGMAMLCASAAVTALGAVGMAGARTRRGRFSGFPRKKS